MAYFFLRIQPRPSNLDISVQHSSPALTSEYYSIVIGVQNKEEGPVADLRVGVALTESLDEMQPTGRSHVMILVLIIQGMVTLIM